MSGFAQDISQVYALGSAKITFNGNDLGHTDENGVKLQVKGKVIEAKVSKYGDTPVSRWMNGQTVEVDFTLMQTDMTILQAAFAAMTAVTNGAGAKKLTLGQLAGTQITAQTLVITPNIVGTPVTTWTMQATPDGDFMPTYEGGKWTGYKCKFVGVVNEAGASNNSWLGQFGDPTITADVTALTATQTTPAQAATGVSTGTTVVTTYNKSLNGSTVNKTSVQLIEDPLGSARAVIADSVALVNNGASTTTTLTPQSALASGKSYAIVLSPSIQDQAGNTLNSGAGYVFYFST